MNETILFSDNSLWGCLNFRGYIIDKLATQGYRVVIVAPNDSFVPVELPNGIIYEPVKMGRTNRNPLQDLSYLQQLYRIYRKYRPQCVFHYTIKPNIYGTFAASRLGIPSVVVITGLGYMAVSKGVTSFVAWRLYHQALKRAKRVLFLNEHDYRTMVRKKKVREIVSILLKGGEGIDLSRFSRETLPAFDERPVFLMIARVLFDKGYTEFVEAAKANPTAKFRLVGALDSNPQAVPEAMVRAEKAIEYLDFVPREQIVEQICKSACVVLPSYHEGMSVTLMEAIALGRPVICSDIAGCREMVDDGVNGYLVPVRDAAALAKACAQFIDLTPEEKTEMGKASRQKAERRFDIETVWQVYQEVLSGLADGKLQ